MPVSGLLKGMNAIFDAKQPGVESELGKEMTKTLIRLEKSLVIQMTGRLAPETLTDATYFFCKFRFGNDHFWSSIERQIEKQAQVLSIQ